MNKKIFKKMFDEHLNISEIHDIVIKQMTFKEKRNIMINVLIPLTIFIVCICSFLLYKQQVSYNNNNNNTNFSSNILKINIIDDETKLFDDSRYIMGDIDGRLEEKTLRDVIKQFEFIKNIEIPINLKNNIGINEMYASGNISNKDYYRLIGYFLRYSFNENESYIDVFFSETNENRPRCMSIIKTDLDDSFINDVPIKIVNYKNEYFVQFKYQEIYFDIETKNINQKDLVKFLNSIVEENK